MPTDAATAIFSIRLPAGDKALLERAARHLGVSKSEFVRRSIAAYAAEVMQFDAGAVDAHYIGQGGGLRRPQADACKRTIVARLREKHGYDRPGLRRSGGCCGI